MNCIFCCVFNQEKYVDMFLLLLESIFIYGDLDNKTLILVYTSTTFMNMIKQSKLFNNDKIKFEINDTYDTIDKACKSRLNIFNLPSITTYNKILYLDTDILIKSSINKVFNVCVEDILYVLEEGNITSGNDWYGGITLFGNEINNYNDKSAFTSGILLFNNCEKIKYLFNKINKDIIKRPYNFWGSDQPYIVYNAFKYNLYNNKILKSFAVNNDFNIHSDKVIHHFPGNPGVYQHKIEYMTIFLNNIKNYTFRIPKVLFQTNKTSNDKYILYMINNKLGSDWKYEFYNDIDVINFFINNPIDDLPYIIQKYNSFKNGAHKADLFRYYYLYVKGGFFMDSDAMLYVNIDTIVKDYNFISVKSSCHPGTIFQGILGASPKNNIIKIALYEAYNTESYILDNNYHYFCKQLFDIIKQTDFGYNIKLYEEQRINHDDGDNILDGERLLFKHYWKHKVIPITITTQYTDEFTKIYNINYWDKGSGSGSYIENTIEYNIYIINFIKNNNIKSITDIGCGDWQSTYLIYDNFVNIDYLGIDCVKSVIETNKKKFPKYNFTTFEILSNIDLIRDSELYIIKDVLQHWKLNDIYYFLDKLVTKQFKYIIICNNADQKYDDLELTTYIGNGRGLNSKYLPLKKYNAELIMDYVGDEKKHMCIIKKETL